MSERETQIERQECAALVRSALKSQYHASLGMLRQAVEACPEDLWYRQDQVNAFWQTAYHTLFFAHRYLQPDEAAFQPWSTTRGAFSTKTG